MKKLALMVLITGVLLTTAAARFLGGWAVVTVENAPDHYVVGKPTTLEFMIRQHGEKGIEGLSPRLEAREEKTGKRVSGGAWATPKTGLYRGSVTIPEAGRWSLVIESGFGPSKGRLLA